MRFNISELEMREKSRLNEAHSEGIKYEVLFIDEQDFDVPDEDCDNCGWSYLDVYRISSQVRDTFSEHDNTAVRDVYNKIISKKINVLATREVVVYFNEYGEAEIVDGVEDDRPSTSMADRKVEIFYPEL